MGTMKYKGYTGSVDFSDEDNCLYGKVLGMSKVAITYEGNDVNELRKDFEEQQMTIWNLVQKEGQNQGSHFAAV